MAKKNCFLAIPKMRSRERLWKITHEPGPWHVTPVGGKKPEHQGEEGESIPKLNVTDRLCNWQSTE